MSLGDLVFTAIDSGLCKHNILSPFKKDFKKFLDNETRDELHMIIQISLIAPYERTENHEWLIEMMQRKYKPDGHCPSNFYNGAGKKLKEEYDELHKTICFLLYGR